MGSIFAELTFFLNEKQRVSLYIGHAVFFAACYSLSLLAASSFLLVFTMKKLMNATPPMSAIAGNLKIHTASGKNEFISAHLREKKGYIVINDDDFLLLTRIMKIQIVQ